METHFTKEQLKDKDNKSSEKILRKCVHCGFCNATCPTYDLFGDELEGPRGDGLGRRGWNGLSVYMD